MKINVSVSFNSLPFFFFLNLISIQKVLALDFPHIGKLAP